MADTTNNQTQPEQTKKALPTVVLVIGMAGSGKTTFVQGACNFLTEEGNSVYTINLDPAVHTIPYSANIDIRDTVNYKEVMAQYKLGPNGGILTSLNLFATRFDQVLAFLENKEGLDYVFVDTPGQIETFTWSASGTIISEALASTFPTIVVYVVDTPRTLRPVTFMSNMLYACSILCKTQLPFTLVFNKIDIEPHNEAQSWMHDNDAFDKAVRRDQTYSGTLSRSMALTLDEFYANIRSVGVSAVTGAGMEELFEHVLKCREEYFTEFLPEIQKRKAEQAQKDKTKQQESMDQFTKAHKNTNAQDSDSDGNDDDDDDDDDDDSS